MSNRATVLALLMAAMSATAAAQNATGPIGPDEDGTKPALTRIAGESLMDSHAFQYLTQLSDQVGGRLTGSAQGQKAIDWGLARMKSLGLQNVRAEKWTLWKSWQRGAASAEILSPVRHSLNIDAMGWTGSTPPAGAEGDVVTANFFDLDDEMRHLDKFRGKIVLLHWRGAPKKTFWPLWAQFGDFLDALKSAGAIAVIGGQDGSPSEGMHLTHTGVMGFGRDFAIPVVSMTIEDTSQLERFVAAGRPVRLRINVQNTFSGPVESANVVGEITGREHPEEIVVVGAHLDSWDLSEGATDNGFGAACVLAAAEAIAKSGAKPRRTIRFVLFNGEEQGLLGSLAYVKQHAAEMKNHLGNVVLDFGPGPIKEFQLGGRNDLVAAMQPFADSLANIHDIKVTDKVVFDTDTGPFILAGLPGINLDQDSPDYKYTHHSAADSLEQVKPDILTQDATIMGLLSFWIADRPERLASPWPPEKTAWMLRTTGNYDMLKAFDLWPFGTMGE